MKNPHTKQRLDKELVDRGLFSSLDQARRAILAGVVSGSSQRLTSAAVLVSPNDYLHIKGTDDKPLSETDPTFVSRGGKKLEGAFAHWVSKGLSVEHKRCVDIGCSTGGFTDCLLQHGAAEVFAVDVGYAQFAWTLRSDKRVKLFERTNIVDFAALPESQGIFDVATVDVSFTSIAHIADALVALLHPESEAILLVKPQFELPKEKVGSGGIVREEPLRQEALSGVVNLLSEKGFSVKGSAPSPVKGTKGNQEYLVWATRTE